MPLELIASLISICRTAIEAGRGLKAIANDQLSDREREILIAGASGGLYQIIRAESVPLLFCNSSSRSFSDNDPATAAHYLEAFRKLCHRGYVVPCDSELFQLSGTGFDVARELAADSNA